MSIPSPSSCCLLKFYFVLHNICCILVPGGLPIPIASRSNNGTDIDVTWNAIVPNRTNGEGYVFRYDIRYFQYDDDINSITLAGGNTTTYKIEGVSKDTEYTVQVRVVVINSTEPRLTFQMGDWGGKLVPKPIGELWHTMLLHISMAFVSNTVSILVMIN